MEWYGPVQCFDANGDGRPDAIFGSQPVKCSLSVGNGQFGSPISSAPEGWFGSKTQGDLNRDGRIDFVTSDYFGGRARVMISQGDGRFTQSQALTTGNYCSVVQVFDMDRDGDLDIIAGTELEGYLRVFLNNGEGSFNTSFDIGNAGQYHRSMGFGDLDNDGDIDIVVQNEWAYNTIRVFENRGNNQFVNATTLTYPGGNLGLALLDYDHDGDLDIVCTTSASDLRVYRKESGGLNFTQAHLASLGSATVGLAVADIDRDGLADLFLSDNGRFGYALGQTEGGFSSITWASVPNKDSFELVDIDSDGDLDVSAGKQTQSSAGTRDFWLMRNSPASISGVQPISGPAEGGTLVTLIGTGFTPTTAVTFGSAPATSVTYISPTRMNAVTPSGLPGLTTVTAGCASSIAFYYRPYCGSDLDQNGVVDTADISIILLDFGPCYQTPLVAPATEVPPLLDAQALPDAPRQR